jgi:hypothetical protein
MFENFIWHFKDGHNLLLQTNTSGTRAKTLIIVLKL